MEDLVSITMASGNEIEDTALAVPGGHIYWAEDLSNSIHIQLANLDGTELRTLVGDDPIGAQSIALDIGSGIKGDLNVNWQLDVGDLNLYRETGVMDHNLFHLDSNDHGLFNPADREYWVHELRATYVGDANLDGEFNSNDLVTVFQEGKYELNVDAGWEAGDWNGEREFTSRDSVLALQDGGYDQGPRVVANAVPEPASFCDAVGWIDWSRGPPTNRCSLKPSSGSIHVSKSRGISV